MGRGREIDRRGRHFDGTKREPTNLALLIIAHAPSALCVLNPLLYKDIVIIIIETTTDYIIIVETYRMYN